MIGYTLISIAIITILRLPVWRSTKCNFLFLIHSFNTIKLILLFYIFWHIVAIVVFHVRKQHWCRLDLNEQSCICVWQLDCGIHPGLEGMDALPYIDLIDPAEIDLLLISQWGSTALSPLHFHIFPAQKRQFRSLIIAGFMCSHFSFHLDHCGALPWFLQKTSFKGRTFMTHATKAIYRWLLSDYVKVR